MNRQLTIDELKKLKELKGVEKQREIFRLKNTDLSYDVAAAAKKYNSNHPLYRRWLSMKHWCLNENNFNYTYYGGRGISYHADFDTFRLFASYLESLAHYAEASDTHNQHGGWSLRRIDSDGDFTYGNLSWSGPGVQRKNKRQKGVRRTPKAHYGVKKCAGVSYVGAGYGGAKKYTVSLIVGGRRLHLGTTNTALEGAILRDSVIEEYELHSKRHYPKGYPSAEVVAEIRERCLSQALR